MEFLDQVALFITHPGFAFGSGLVAAFTPCTLSLIPIFLYRFGLNGQQGNSGSKRYVDIGLVLIGFLGSFAVTGLLFGGLVGSDFVNITRLVLGVVLVLVGILQIFHKLSLQFFTKITNPLGLGIVLPWAISFSPCVIPFLSVILTGIAESSDVVSTTQGIANFLMFGLGLITPAILISLLGGSIVKGMKKISTWVVRIESVSAVLIVVAGFYMSSQLVQLANRDVVISALLILVVLILMAREIFKVASRRTVLNYQLFGVLLLLWLAGLVAAIIITAPYGASISGEELVYSCLPGNGHTNSPAALPVALIGSSYAALMAGWYIVSNRKGSIVKFNLQQ